MLQEGAIKESDDDRHRRVTSFLPQIYKPFIHHTFMPKLTPRQAEEISNDITGRLMKMCVPHAPMTAIAARTSTRQLQRTEPKPTSMAVDSPKTAICRFKPE